ncbi:glycosyltransferase family 4 protein [Sulfitobacter sp. JB4-11]|uniref:glycosyltransferase family 4 protein n=1 Tax=Sulfitobacter rhodophyticola TaxID=3238304 RepID=UPI0035183BB1
MLNHETLDLDAIVMTSTLQLLHLPRYSRRGASSRLRTFQYVDAVEAAEIKLRTSAFFDDKYLERIYTSGQSRRTFLKFLRARTKALRKTPKPQAIWLEKEAFPWLPWSFERRMLPRNVPVISDYDDAVFHRYDGHRRAIVRMLLGNKIDRVMANSTLVVAGNAYLAERARRAGAKWVEVVPTVVDLKKYKVDRQRPEADRDLTVGWIGTPETWGSFAVHLFDDLAGAPFDDVVTLRAVGASLTPQMRGQIALVPWVEAKEVREIQQFDIGVMPLPDTPWARGKCGYKLIQYMACGIPVIASPVGVNTEIVEHGVNGFLARSEAEWIDAIETLKNDVALRHRMGDAGREKVEKHYSLQVWAPKLVEMIKSAVAPSSRLP